MLACMSTAVDTEARLADALRVLLPFAVADEPEWAPERELASRRIAYAMAALALADHDEARANGTEERPASQPVLHLLPESAPALPLAA
jgi:hypothetical protein